MAYRAGLFAFDDVTDKGSRGREKFCALPPTRKCRDRSHVFSEFVGTPVIDGIEHITARCPDCGEEVTFPAYARHRR